MAILISKSSEETLEIGEAFGKTLAPGSVVCFFGNLAAGKTTFIKGLVKGACQLDPEQVISPTFVYLNEYEGIRTVYHFDLYRLNDSREFLSMGFDEYLGGKGICCIEWSEKVSDLINPTFRVELLHRGENERQIIIEEFKRP